MARADSILVNDNKFLKDTRAIDEFINPHVFSNKFVKFKKNLEVGAEIIDIDARYDFRPDRLAYEYYSQDFWFPAILAVNNMGSILQFKADAMNYKCKIPTQAAIEAILSETSTNNSDDLNRIHQQFN